MMAAFLLPRLINVAAQLSTYNTPFQKLIFKPIRPSRTPRESGIPAGLKLRFCSSHSRAMAEEPQPKLLLQGVEMFGKEKRWIDIKFRFFSHEEDLTTHKLKKMWKILVKIAKKSSHKRGGDHLPEEIWAKVLNMEAEGSQQQA